MRRLVTAAQFGVYLARVFAPYLVAIVLMLLIRLLADSQSFGSFVPMVGLMFTFFWTLHRPLLVPFWAVFLLGLIEDIISVGPLGLTSILLLIVVAALHDQRKFFLNRAFALSWAGFAILSVLAYVVTWLLTSFHEMSAMPPLPLLAQVATTVLVFPLFAWLFGYLDKRVIMRKRRRR